VIQEDHEEDFLTFEDGTGYQSQHLQNAMIVMIMMMMIIMIYNEYTGWSRGNACFSHKNNFVGFQDKTFLITQKRRYFNAFLTYITYGK
jgi:predicted ATP-grasp superfamily ATP-dependent carboligase